MPASHATSLSCNGQSSLLKGGPSSTLVVEKLILCELYVFPCTQLQEYSSVGSVIGVITRLSLRPYHCTQNLGLFDNRSESLIGRNIIFWMPSEATTNLCATTLYALNRRHPVKIGGFAGSTSFPKRGAVQSVSARTMTRG